VTLDKLASSSESARSLLEFAKAKVIEQLKTNHTAELTALRSEKGSEVDRLKLRIVELEESEAKLKS
jgi:hypothetical protein